jgi:hypothetical protein
MRAEWGIVTLFDTASNKKAGSEEPASICGSAALAQAASN